ncbi:MAG: YheV family putative zinc ribbon protein [Glaciecola sp.]|mgnify:FL=1|jgi:uncharacterized metal-binding protein (TIGR02443 family)|nr:YheV family putative metal-binding protein [Glaciecola sp.]MDG1254396.1 YheV family putative zinc ribbon protein [Glaciecola sp.]MDG1468290.1 YheV family putative zinc ribbon protein [Glaciecola sp.]MDG1922662.1 YheV family putative zinc ribbon protein [Glaciecola sp.]
MTNKLRKRFIAGATCPKCKSIDSIMLYFENNVEKLQCVKCDYKDVQSATDVSAQVAASADVIGVFKP